jgi:signal transduction histidine kinase
MRTARRATRPSMIDALPAPHEGAPNAAAAESFLPRRAMWFFVVGPPLLAFLFDPSCLKEPWHVARAMVAIEAFTLAAGLAVHLGLEGILARLRSPGARAVAAIAAVPAIVAAVSVPLLPFVERVYPEAAGAELAIVGRAVLVAYAYVAVAALVGHLQRREVRERLRAQEERALALESRLAALRAQMQPHFLFNSLNVCAGLVHSDPDAAEASLDRLAGFLRYALASTERRLVPLEQELDAIASYLEVQQRRFGARLRFEVRSDAVGWSIPPMLLQPIVENAICHGLAALPEGGSVSVSATARDGALVVVVEDDGVGPGGSTHAGTGHGQRNVRERLRLMYGARARLETGPAPGGGYRSELVVPEGR